MRLTDWRGNEYGIGDTVLYPRTSGRSVEMSEATVADIYHVYYGDNYKWERWDGEGPEPTKRVFDGWDEEGNRKTKEVSGLEIRVQLQPTGHTSRNFGYYSGREYKDGKRIEKLPNKVTMVNIANITALEG